MNRLGLILVTAFVFGAALLAALVMLGLDPAPAFMVVGAVALIAYLLDAYVKLRG